MTAARLQLDLSHIDKTRANLYKLSIYFLGLTAAEKMTYADQAYKHFFGETLDQTLSQELKALKKYDLNTRERRTKIIGYLKEHILSITEYEIVGKVFAFVYAEAEKNRATLALQALTQDQRKLEKFFAKHRETSPEIIHALIRKSRRAWRITIAEMSKLKSYTEYFFPKGWRSAVSYLIRSTSLILAIERIESMAVKYGHMKEEDRVIKFDPLIGLFVSLACIEGMEYVSNYVIEKIHPTIDPSLDEIDEILMNGLDQFSQTHLTEKLKIDNLELTFNPASNATEEKTSEPVDESEEEDSKTEKPVKRRNQPSVAAEEKEEKEEKKVAISSIRKGDNIYLRMNYEHHAACFFRYNREEIKDKLTADRQYLLNKFKNAIFTRRVNPPNSKKTGVTQVDSNEFDKYPDGYKVRIKENERLPVHLRVATDEENELGMEEVMSPKGAMRFHD